ncbi:MAG: CYTH domain-containing protein [Flavobacteriia bacterium]|jgi:adenylate cyclase|nr:CYTH domain-containing protein [Flavobacteriia bacterium]NBV68802.1 CYTH domain-containing protein [Flavobacteriia bacterium]
MWEIERKFIVDKFKLNSGLLQNGVEILQGYVWSDPDKSLRIRIYGDSAFLTIKLGVTALKRQEFEYEIPRSDADALLLQCSAFVEKVRYEIPLGKFTWEVDVFKGANEGLVLAEIELTDENETFEFPEWIGEEVTHDARYLNANLIKPRV